MTDLDRSRRVSWQNPAIIAEAVRTMSGLEFLQAMIRGDLPPPPIAQLMGFTMVEAQVGQVIFEVQPAEYHYNPIGMVHGGMAATLLDSAMACAVQTHLTAGVGYTSLDIQVNYVRPISSDTGLLRCIGEVIHLGGRIATAQGRLVDAEAKIYAHGSTTCMIFR